MKSNKMQKINNYFVVFIKTKTKFIPASEMRCMFLYKLLLSGASWAGRAVQNETDH